MPSLVVSDTQRIRQAVRDLVEKHTLPGLALGVVSGEDLVFAEGFGYADIESKRPQSPELRQRIGSITKTMTGLCAMALVDEGRLSLDDRLVDHIPDVKLLGPAETITVRHLLTHTSGIGEAPQLKELADPDIGLWTDGPPLPVSQAYPDGIVVEVPAGTKWAYANHAFALLGEIVSRIEKAPIHEVVKRRVFDPLGMADSDMLDLEHADLTTGYHRPPNADVQELLTRIGRSPESEETVDGVNIRNRRHQYTRGPALGGVQSTIPDMARYASALLRDSRGIVRPQTFRQMVRPQWCPDPRLPAWGLSFSVRPYSGHPGFGHGGSIIGWNSYLAVFPQDDLAVILHVNAVLDEFDAVVATVLQAVLGEPDWRTPDTVHEAQVLATAPGVYELPMPGPLTNFRPMTQCGRVQVVARDGGLVLYSRRGPWKRGVPLLRANPSEPDLLALPARPQPQYLAALRDRQGNVTGLRFPQLYDMHRTESATPWV